MSHSEFQHAAPIGGSSMGGVGTCLRLGAAATAALWIVLTGPGSAIAQGSTYHITEAEKAACTPDAQRLCSSAYPDEDKLLTCMTANQRSLSAGCAVVFKAGKKERGLR